MTVENATYLSDLEPTLPASTDSPTEGDNHIRLIKEVLQATFPNINGPVTATDEELNTLVGGGGGGGGGGGEYVPLGAIILWAGDTTNIPAGYALCDGSRGTPDLRYRFIMGAGASGPGAGETGGSWTHDHGAAVGYTTLGVEHLPPHNHGGGDHAHTQFGYYKNFQLNAETGAYDMENLQWYSRVPTDPSGVIIATQGGGQGHTHSITPVSHTPAYYALCYIMRIS